MAQLKEQEPQFSDLERTAWILGVLCGGGTLNPSGEITLRSIDREFLEHFALQFCSVIAASPKPIKQINRPERTTSYQFSVFSRKLVEHFGDLSKKNWPSTLLKKHPWLETDPLFIACFLSGYFDVNGSLSNKPIINLSVSNEDAKNMIISMLLRIHVKKIFVERNVEKKVRTVQIMNQKEQAKFTKRIGFEEISYKNNALKQHTELLSSSARFNAYSLAAYEIVLYLNQTYHSVEQISTILSELSLHQHKTKIINWIKNIDPYERVVGPVDFDRIVTIILEKYFQKKLKKRFVKNLMNQMQKAKIVQSLMIIQRAQTLIKSCESSVHPYRGKNLSTKQNFLINYIYYLLDDLRNATTFEDIDRLSTILKVKTKQFLMIKILNLKRKKSLRQISEANVDRSH